MKTLLMLALEMIRNFYHQNATAGVRMTLGGLTGILLISVLSGCEIQDPIEEVRSVKWYETYATERTEKLAQCKKNPGLLDGTPGCVNASRAENNVQKATRWSEDSDADEVRTTPLITQ